VLEGAKVELNDTDGSKVGNGYTRCDVTYNFAIFSGFCLISLRLSFDIFQIYASSDLTSTANIAQMLQ